jgi:hypothetical protein
MIIILDFNKFIRFINDKRRKKEVLGQEGLAIGRPPGTSI